MLLQRHYIKEFFKLWAIMALGVGAVLALFDFMKAMEIMGKSDPTSAQLVMYVLFRYPSQVLDIMPVATLMSALFTVGQASRHRELVVVMAAGGRLRRLFMPFVLTGALLTVFGFLMTEVIVPYGSTRAQDIKREVRGDLPVFSIGGVTWIRCTDGSLARFELYDEPGGTIQGVSIFRPEGGQLREVLMARSGRFDAAVGWMLQGVTRLRPREGGYERLAEVPYPFLTTPDMFKEQIWKPHEMSFLQLREYVRKLREAGFRNQRLTVEMHFKLASPMVNIIMVMLGVAFASRRTMGGLMATAAGLGITVLYWVGLTFSQSMGYAGVLPPPVAAWAMPACFLALALWLYTRIPE
jgi:lipopolysaccharide export system permease protein